jgi:UDP-galactopyranose mutase
MIYDYLICGSGLVGAVIARKMQEAKKKILIIEKRNHIGGNCYTENINGINVHKYGCHIFHTNKKDVWEFVNKFSKFNNYRHKGIVNYKNKIYSFPINLMTLSQLWGVNNPDDAKKRLDKEKVNIKEPKNLEEWCLANIGKEVYKIFIKGYTKKQWNTDPKNLPTSIIKRIPIRFDFNDDYFHDNLYQGIPEEGYTNLISNIIGNVRVELGVNLFKTNWKRYAKKLIYCGPIDQYYDYCFGKLDYRSLSWQTKEFYGDFQGHSVVNYTDENIKHTRIIEHKHFQTNKIQDYSLISYEYPQDYTDKNEPYYPINDEKNNLIYSKYQRIENNNVIFTGRLGKYKYIDMDDAISLAIKTVEKELA